MASAVGRPPASGMESSRGKGESPAHVVLEPPSARGSRRRSFFFDGLAKATRRSAAGPKRSRGDGASSRSFTSATVSTETSSVNPRDSDNYPIPNSIEEAEMKSNRGAKDEVRFAPQHYDDVEFHPADHNEQQNTDRTPGTNPIRHKEMDEMLKHHEDIVFDPADHVCIEQPLINPDPDPNLAKEDMDETETEDVVDQEELSTPHASERDEVRGEQMSISPNRDPNSVVEKDVDDTRIDDAVDQEEVSIDEVRDEHQITNLDPDSAPGGEEDMDEMKTENAVDQEEFGSSHTSEPADEVRGEQLITDPDPKPVDEVCNEQQIAKPDPCPNPAHEEDMDETKTDHAPDQHGVSASSTAEPESESETKEEQGEEQQTSSEGNLLEGKKVAVFNANTSEGTSIVRSLAKKGNEVVAIVRVFTSKNVRGLFRTEGVTITVADSRHDTAGIVKALQGCDRVFMVTKFWEKFDGVLEEQQARTVFEACNKAGVKNVVFSTFEDVSKLTQRGQRSQILPGENGKIEPTFAGMKDAIAYAKSLNVRVTHMITSYLNEEMSKNSICLIKGGGKLIISSQFEKDGE